MNCYIILKNNYIIHTFHSEKLIIKRNLQFKQKGNFAAAFWNMLLSIMRHLIH